jgi:hypothetical protein
VGADLTLSRHHRVCGTAWAGSDWDFTIVVDDAFEPEAPDMLQVRSLALPVCMDHHVPHNTLDD